MIKFDDTGILTGYIKQKLHSFPLPTVDVLSDLEAEETLIPNTIYIYEGQFQKYLGDKRWQSVPEVL